MPCGPRSPSDQRPGLDQVDELLLAVHAELAVDSLDVGLHSVAGEGQLVLDVLVVAPAREQGEQLLLARGKAVFAGQGLAGAPKASGVRLPGGLKRHDGLYAVDGLRKAEPPQPKEHAAQEHGRNDGRRHKSPLVAGLGHTDDECSEVVDVDVLVVGAGCSGLPAAVTAAEGGTKVMLVDRMEQGFGIRCSALGAIDSSIQQELGVTIDKMDILNDIARYVDGQCDMRIWKMWADESGEAVSWYIDHCNQSGAVYVENEYNMPEDTRYRCWPTGHASLGVEMK